MKTECYCAFCKTPRKVYVEKSIRFRHLFWSFLLGSSLSFLIWREWNPRSLLFFVVGAMLAEIFVKIRWRIQIVCRNCGFDPVIYVKDPQRAAEIVKGFLDRRAEDPQYLLKAPLNLPKRKAPQPADSRISVKI
jgi:hypothetical protein